MQFYTESILGKKSQLNKFSKLKYIEYISKCEQELEKSLNNKENFFFNTLSSHYQTSVEKNKYLLKKKLKNKILIVGMGGSVLGAKTIASYLGLDNYFFLDDLSVYDIFNLINKDLKNFSIFIISKSGNTLETIINFNLLIKKIGKKFMKNFIIISQRNTNLHKFAINNNLIFFEHNSNLSGRYSVLSEVGLIMFSINKKEILNAIQFVISKKFKKILIKNTAFLFTLMKFSKVNQHVFLIYSKELLNFGYWHQQLLAESIGKDSMDFTPWVSMCPKDNHSIMQLFLGGKKNKFFSFLKIVKNKKDYLLTQNNLLNKNLNNTKLSKVIDAQFNATVNVFKKNNIPHRVILINEKKPKDLISLFVYSMLETVLLCKMSRVNPFNQPAVESIKKETLRILK